jgi:hypothetical protein
MLESNTKRATSDFLNGNRAQSLQTRCVLRLPLIATGMFRALFLQSGVLEPL